jgi:hypothetical protein
LFLTRGDGAGGSAKELTMKKAKKATGPSTTKKVVDSYNDVDEMSSSSETTPSIDADEMSSSSEIF